MGQRETAAEVVILKNKIKVLTTGCRVGEILMVSHTREGERLLLTWHTSCPDLIFFNQREMTSPGGADTG